MSTQLFLVALFVVSLFFMFWNFKKKRKKIIFFGDSITAYGAATGGFIRLLERFFSKEGILQKFELVNAGVNGNKIYDLFIRLEPQVLAKDPTLVIIFIGVNDVWHKQNSGTGTDLKTFENVYEQIISRLKAVHSKIVLVTPAAIGERPLGQNEMDQELDQYCEVVKTLAQKNELHVVDLRSVFAAYNNHYNVGGMPYGILTTDGVHLNERGNEVVADEIWKKMEILFIA